MSIFQKHRTWIIPLVVVVAVIATLFVMTSGTLSAHIGYRSF